MKRKCIQYIALATLFFCNVAVPCLAQSSPDFAYVLLRGTRESAVSVSINDTESGKIFPGLSKKLSLPSAGNFRISLADANGRTFDTTLTVSDSDAGKTFQIRFPDAVQASAATPAKQESTTTVAVTPASSQETLKPEKPTAQEPVKTNVQENASSATVPANTASVTPKLAEFTKLASELTVLSEEVKAANENAAQTITKLKSTVTTYGEGIPQKNALLARLVNFRERFDAFVEPALKLQYTSPANITEVSDAIARQQALLAETRSQLATYQGHMDSIGSLFDQSILVLEKTLLDFGKMATTTPAATGKANTSAVAKSFASLMAAAAVPVDMRIQTAINELDPLQQATQKMVNELSSTSPVNLVDYQKKLAEHTRSHEAFLAEKKKLGSAVESLKKNSKDAVLIQKCNALFYEFEAKLLIYQAHLMAIETFIKGKSGKK